MSEAEQKEEENKSEEVTDPNKPTDLPDEEVKDPTEQKEEEK